MKKEVLTLDLGGTHLRIACVKNGKIINFIRKETSQNKTKLLKEIVEGIEECVEKNVKRIGISCAGVIDNGIVRNSPNLPLENFNLKKYLQNKFKAKVEIENDANCVALAEAKYGVKRKNFFILTLGTGIGGGIIIDGKLYKGRVGAGEFGGMILNDGKNFENEFKKSKPNVDKIANVVGKGISSLISVFDPEVIIISGGLTKLGNKFLSKIKSQTKKYMHLQRMPEIKFSKLENPGILGASLLFD